MSELATELRHAGIAEVDDSDLARALYSSDASLYRLIPRVVVYPRHTDEIEATLDVCRRLGVPVTARGAGTSLAGNAVGTGVVFDTSRHLGRVLEIDRDARLARVEPGTVHATLQQQVLPLGLRFGPDPATHSRCTIGGMIGNNSCGSHAMAYGRTSDNVLGLDVVTGTGMRMALGDNPSRPGGIPDTSAARRLTDPLKELVEHHLGVIRTEFGRFPRQISGYAMEHLLPEKDFHLARFLVGSEGTLVLVLGATVRLVDDPSHTVLAVLGFPSMADAADACPGLREHQPTACECMDSRIVAKVRQQPHATVPDLPEGAAWLMVELSGEDADELADRAKKVVHDTDCTDSMVVTDEQQTAEIWRIREDGAGLTAHTPAGRPAQCGWEDAAVPVEQLGDYFRGFERLLKEHGLTGVPYGHFGSGCVHVRIDFPFGEGPDNGLSVYRGFVEQAAQLAADHGGSMSGEHGDGRARSELLHYMYSPEALDLFAGVKAIFDPEEVLNPGVLVRPAPLDADVRMAERRPLWQGLAMSYDADGGDFSKAVHRCIGVAKCRADNTAGGGVMCPSYLATREEKDSTRGRARVLQEMVAGGRPPDWGAPEVHEALDLCLSCKGCSRDCPAGVDMPTWKSEVLYQTYRGRPRPRAHYALGRLPQWADLAARMPWAANALMRNPVSGRVAKATAGVDQRRSLPAFADETFRQLWARRRGGPAEASRPLVVLWVDTFTDHFAPQIAVAAVRVLEAAGYRIEVPGADTCCGLTWISTGQLDQARKILGSTVTTLSRYAARGLPIVGLEPSCTATLRSDALELVGGSDAETTAQAVHTLAEQLTSTQDWQPPDLSGLRVVAQPHCHQHAVMGWGADNELLQHAGADVQRLGGCCGLAGNWGVEQGHYDVSVAIAEHQLLPAARSMPHDGVLLADGFSCRTQLEQLAPRQGIHLAQLLERHAG